MKITTLKKLLLSITFCVIIVMASSAATTENSCLLKIIAANDLARTASIYVDDKLAGTLESGELVVFDMDVGPHVITLDGELVEMYTLEVFFQNAFEAKQLELNAKPGKRAVRIISEPSSAAIRLDNEWLEQTTPWQIILDVGKTYEIELFKELYGGKAQSLYIPNKGEVIILDIEIPEADPPLKPRLTYPIDKSVFPDEIVVELVWESLDNPLQYELEFDGKVYTTSFSNARFYNLERGKTYSWRVTAVNKYGMRTTSERYSFTIQENRGPEIAFVYPQNDSDDVFAEELILKWEVTDADGDSITCDVYFGDEPGSLEIVKSHTTSNEYIVKELERGKTYYWKIVSTDSYGEVGESLVYTFVTMANRPPIEPFNIIPQDGKDNLPECVTLEWDCTDPDNDNLTYAVYLGADKDSMKQMGETTNKKFALNDLARGTTYYWKIVVFDSFGAKTEGPINSFNSIANISPVIDSNPEVLLRETDRAVFADLKWFCEDPDDKLLLYDVYFGVDTEPSLILADCDQTTLIKENLNFGTTYYWQISAKDEHGGISKGPMWEFTTNDPPIYIPSDFVSEMVLVEEGSFTMGDTWGDGAIDEQPTHKVTFTYNFYIGKYETTFNEYDAFCETTGRSKPSDGDWGRGTRPVIYVSWNDAIAYCNWLSEKEGLPKAYDNNGNLLDKGGMITTDPSKVVGYRLPTEAEWEYAARAGNKSKGYKYAGSDNVNDVAWYKDNSGDRTQEVGKKTPNELDIYDMSGNVWEWCSDCFEFYSSSAQINPYNSTAGSDRVIRGGSCRSGGTHVRVAHRDNLSPTFTEYGLGFRICRTVPYEGENRPPLSPYNPSPSDEAMIVGVTSVTLSWDSYDPDGDTMTYDVYFDTNVNPTTKVSSNQTENTLIRSNLSYDTTYYYWKVVAKGSKGATTEGPEWKFTKSVVHEGMVLVEKGSFKMGDTWGDGHSDEQPTHKVTFTYNFYIGKYETTFNEYDAFCEATGRSKPDDEGWGRESRPVINVTWWDAIAYCNWLSEKEKLPKAYDSNGNLLDKNGSITTDPSKVVGYRLPTEAEWEYAARGGNKSKGYKFSGSDNVDEVAWYWQNSGYKTQEVGNKAPNELGIYDMSGNVWEWCSDCFEFYSISAQTNPYNNSGSRRMIRGGVWSIGATDSRVADRGSGSPTGTDDGLGFRICRTVP